MVIQAQAADSEEYAVECARATYGMQLHWGKTKTLRFGDAGCLKKLDGNKFDDTAAH